MKLKLVYLLVFTVLISCGNTNKEKTKAQQKLANANPVEAEVTKDGYQKAYFASGCFWCVEAIYESVKGVKESISGYAGGTGKNPTYQNYGNTGHAEAVEVIYDPEVVSFKTLVEVYFASQNVTQKNGQGPDKGREYRSIIFYQNPSQQKIISEKIEALSKEYNQPIAAEVMPFQKFWKAEDYHQDYKKKHPENAYVQNVSIPRFNKFKRNFPSELLK
ncbi:peptide-methionine (S)-S-oxide reductase MsrA [Mesonia aestuariivivens]|uniref:Peptide methionine sulfoxide reductase MsrA n=1 Tax=Mesonia aestuariivivens TaxID=2796128 RepID=A0ABS6W548_9FLAO|nr:peptide-methionine (S)-S-oxide reductase MsrA [Mesonia aestuariivivens]MBW2962991.1 peptide-methionine (S)-S-oxide reductase MsrA [Mesonia aestuariivivens]